MLVTPSGALLMVLPHTPHSTVLLQVSVFHPFGQYWLTQHCF
jgi:hypothetical protein